MNDEISDAMAAPMGTMNDMDDDDLEEELKFLEDELADDDEDALVSKEPATTEKDELAGLLDDLPGAPSAPVRPAPVEEKKEEPMTQEDKELAELNDLLA